MKLDLCLKTIIVISFFATKINASPFCSPSSYCEVQQWAQWSNCNATCGLTGIKRREKYFCCESSRYNTLAQCLGGCNITTQWWQTNSVEIRTCGYCKYGGTFNSNQNVCDCRHGYGGKCCDVKTTRSPTTHIMTPTERTATTPTKTSPKMTTPTKKPTTTTTKPTTITTKPTTTTTKKTTPTPKLTTTDTKPTFTTSFHIASGSDCMAFPCQNGACVTDSQNQNICICEDGYKGKFCEKDTDDCASDPCLYGTCMDKVDDFQCECLIFFDGKRCSKVKTWALAFLGLLILSLLACCCWCCWCIFTKCNREEEDNKVKPIETHKPLPASKANYNSWL